MTPHDAATDRTDCYPLTGRHLQVAAILGHAVHGGRVRLTVTQARQIGELVAWGEGLVNGLSVDLTAARVLSGLRGSTGDVPEAYSGAEGVADREVA